VGFHTKPSAFQPEEQKPCHIRGVAQPGTAANAQAEGDLTDCKMQPRTGLRREFSRFCIRTGNKALISVLEEFEGEPWHALMAAAGSWAG
jgi:hypothetical protein